MLRCGLLLKGGQLVRPDSASFRSRFKVASDFRRRDPLG